MISFIAKLFVALNSNSRPSELASGIACGFWLALIPGGNLLWTVLFVIAFLLKHNLAALLLSLGLFRLSVPSLIDPFLDSLGGRVLEMEALHPFFTKLYNIPLLPYSNFNNTLVMGGFLLGLVCWIPVFILFLQLVKIYRKKVAARFAESKLVNTLKKIPLLSKISKAVGKLSKLA